MSSLPPPATHLADRTVVVSGARQGSGVLLTDRLVLTCPPVVKTGSVHVAHPALPDRVRATVTWIDYRLDVALLEATEPVLALPPVRLGVLDTRKAIPGCEITGFSRIQRYGRDRRLEVDQYTVTVLPMVGRVRDLLVCDLDGPPAAGPDEEPPARTRNRRPCPDCRAARSSRRSPSCRPTAGPAPLLREERVHSNSPGGSAVRGGVRAGAGRRVPPYEDLRPR